MDFSLMPLPFEQDALAPFIGARTVDIHHTRHHGGYVSKLDNALGSDPLREEDLTTIMLESSGKTFDLAAQVWNHNFYWQSLAVESEPLSEGTLHEMIGTAFGDLKSFKRRFADAAADQFGSGWAWLVFNPASAALEVVSTTDAQNPLTREQVPLLTLDVWEHAYYLDYQNDRGGYIQAFLDSHVNWAFAEDNLNTALKRHPL